MTQLPVATASVQPTHTAPALTACAAWAWPEHQSVQSTAPPAVTGARPAAALRQPGCSAAAAARLERAAAAGTARNMLRLGLEAFPAGEAPGQTRTFQLSRVSSAILFSYLWILGHSSYILSDV